MPVVVSARMTELAERYGDAWNSHDLDEIVALHSNDSVFELHLPGSTPAEGREAIRATFAGFLQQLPDVRFATKRLHAGLDHWVNESILAGTVATSVELDGKQLDAPEARVEVACVDVIAVHGGQVTRKDTYLDAVTFLRQLGLS